jgi:hypothetical protein
MNNELIEFQKSFTKEQKAAIFGCLMTVARCDGEVHPKEYASAETSAKALGLDLQAELPLLKVFGQGGLDKMIPILQPPLHNHTHSFLFPAHG